MKHTIPKYLFWRGNSLWSRFPLPGRPARYPLEIYSDGSATDKKNKENLGAAIIGKLSTEIIEGRFFDKKEAEVPVYRPKVWRVVGRYWYYHLRFKNLENRSAKHYARESLKKFGSLYWNEVTPERAESWLQGLRADGYEVNSVNSSLSFLKAAFQYCVNSPKMVRTHIPNPVKGNRLDKSPIAPVKKLKGGKIREYLLTEPTFERNYKWFSIYYPTFAVFYLCIWLMGRRPRELSLYTWEMITEREVKGEKIHCFSVPPEICKMQKPDLVPIPERLWQAIFSQGWRTGLVFRNTRNGRWKYWFDIWNKLKKAFPDSDPGVFRDGRRGFATHAVHVLHKRKEDVKAMTAHKSDSMFNRYCIGSLEGKTNVTHPGLGEKEASEGTEKGTKCA